MKYSSIWYVFFGLFPGVCSLRQYLFFVPHKILRKNPDSEYYNKGVKRLKVRGRKGHNKGKLGQTNKLKLKRISKELLAAQKFCTGNTFAISITK
jgi:hypothetical protein